MGKGELAVSGGVTPILAFPPQGGRDERGGGKGDGWRDGGVRLDGNEILRLRCAPLRMTCGGQGGREGRGTGGATAGLGSMATRFFGCAALRSE